MPLKENWTNEQTYILLDGRRRGLLITNLNILSCHIAPTKVAQKTLDAFSVIIL